MKKNKFSCFERDVAIPCPSGERKKDRFMLVRKGNNMSLTKTGEVDIQEQIDSYEDGVSLPKMIERFRRGDTSALSRGEGFYGDVSGFSPDVVDVLNNGQMVAEALEKLSKTEKVEEAAAQDPADTSSEQQPTNSENGKESE